ncbi:MAG: sigma 54-interacting transcriptional regulator [Labilithrix sp.]
MSDEYRTLLRESAPGDAQQAAFFLSVVEGPDKEAGLLVDPSSPSRLYVGTSPSCDLALSDREVSRRHLALEASGRQLRVTDLGSTNGTTADGVRVVEVLLTGGEVLRLGGTAMTIERRPALAAAPAAQTDRFGRYVGSSPAMQRLYPLCQRLAQANVPVIIEGETGTGKEVLAEALHEMGPRASGPFVVFDCTAVPPNLVESELFGHERGAFTGAVNTRKGVFEQAQGGTLLIDEIGDLEVQMQPKLLRVLERSEVRRVGGDKPIKVDVRVLFATRRDLEKMVEEGKFRDDLFHRMSVGRIELPPLRRRAGDIARLAQHFAREQGGQTLPASLLAKFEADPWPGNVRALRNAVARWLALGDLSDQMPESARVSPPTPSAGGDPNDAFMDTVLDERLPLAAAREKVIAEFERRYVERVLADNGGSVARAAEASGIARRHFQRIKARGKE